MKLKSVVMTKQEKLLEEKVIAQLCNLSNLVLAELTM